ncbi:MAG: hypothetical protein JSW11_11545 [Candidatus Heimdallarchaeota archaeon]|nr:MAG: hypothetical protein JSW11_11545 [Candidatus Heimdallarchaeota archaeon]
MKTRDLHENHYQQIVEFGRSRPWLPLVGIIYASVAAIVLTQYSSFFIPELSISTVQFSLSLSALLILSAIGLYLLSNNYQTIWGLSFLLYAFSFLGLCLRIFGLPLTDINNPLIFHIWLLPIIFFASGVWIGTSRLFSENNKLNYLPALLILLGGESWFLIGFFILKDATLTVFVLIYGLFIPVVLFFTYSWFRLAKTSIFVSPWFLSLGFLLMAIAYFFWNPWMSSDLDQLYGFFFVIFNVALGMILGGFFILSRDLTKYPETS